MKATFITIFLTSLLALANAQSDIKNTPSRNKTVYGEIGGPGIFTANFDTRFGHKPSGLGLRVGIGIVPGVFSSALTVPLGLNFLAGKNKHYFEAEGGTSFIHMFGSDSKDWFSTDPSSEWIKYFYAGYRYKAPDGFTARIGFCPLFSEGMVQPWMGVSVGYSF